MNADAWTPIFVRANEIDFATYQIGSGPPILFLHGFPELAYSWRHQMKAVADGGWRAVAVDLRGAGATGPHGDLASYSLKNLASDVVNLIAAMDLGPPVIIGHDFGGALAWGIARDHSNLISGVVSVNTPYTKRGRQDLGEMMRIYRGEANYMLTFREPEQGEAILRDARAVFTNLFRKSLLSLGEVKAHPRLAALPATLFSGEPDIMGDPIMSPADIDVFVSAYERTGFTGSLNWYRNLHRNWEDTRDDPEQVTVPALMISASDDYFLPPDTCRGMDEIVSDLEYHVIADCGHWTQHEQPAALNGLILAWLERRMRPLFEIDSD